MKSPISVERGDSRSTGIGWLSRLTNRQITVLSLAIEGFSDKQIANRLAISPRTVEDHFAKIRERSGIRSRGKLIASAAMAGLASVECSVVGTVEGVRIGYTDPFSCPSGGSRGDVALLRVARCDDILVEESSGDSPKPILQRALIKGATLVVHEVRELSKSVSELLILVREDFQSIGINLEVMSGPCAGFHGVDGRSSADVSLFKAATLVFGLRYAFLSGEWGDDVPGAMQAGRRAMP